MSKKTLYLYCKKITDNYNDMSSSIKKQFKVGDVVIIKNCYGSSVEEVIRLTKTQAITKSIANENLLGKFRIDYIAYDIGDGKTHYSVTPVPYIEWDTNEYVVIAK